MRNEQFDRLLQQTRVIAILRGVAEQDAAQMIQALYDGGIRLAEITLNTDGALAAISHLHSIWQGRMMIGAGTVTCIQEAEAAFAAGAQFIVTPNTDPDVIRFCAGNDLPITPGALTPSEIVTAKNCGSTYVKLFPADCMGAGYVRQLLGPLKGTKLLAVGGVDAQNAAAFISSGVYGLGVGGALCRVPEDRDFSALTRAAQELIEICRTAKS